MTSRTNPACTRHGSQTASHLARPHRFFHVHSGLRRHQTRSTIMTSNRPLEDWGKLLGDVPSASAILDRFLHHAEIITFQGRSYRLKNRLADDSKTGSEPATGSKPASAPTGNRRPKPATAAVDTTSQTATT